MLALPPTFFRFAARAPGADDNALDTVCVLEVLRVLAQAGFKFNNTLEFHWYAAEEAERAGSHYVSKHYEAVGKRVVAMLNQDMTGYSPSDAMFIVINGVDPALTEYVEVVATAYSDKPPTKTECPRDYGSDHSSAVQYGFPAAFVFEDQYDKSNPWIHSSNDTPDKIQWKAVLRHARFSVGFVVEASYLNPRLADGKGQKPKPVQPSAQAFLDRKALPSSP